MLPILLTEANAQAQIIAENAKHQVAIAELALETAQQTLEYLGKI